MFYKLLGDRDQIPLNTNVKQAVAIRFIQNHDRKLKS